MHVTVGGFCLAQRCFDLPLSVGLFRNRQGGLGREVARACFQYQAAQVGQRRNTEGVGLQVTGEFIEELLCQVGGKCCQLHARCRLFGLRQSLWIGQVLQTLLSRAVCCDVVAENRSMAVCGGGFLVGKEGTGLAPVPQGETA